MLKTKSAPGLSLIALGLFASGLTAVPLIFTVDFYLITVAQTASSGKSLPFGHTDRVAPFVPTPMDVVEKMLRLTEVDHTDTVYDLGSGDGRIVVMAAQKFGARAVGVELDDDLYKKSSHRITEFGLESKAKILHANMYEVDLRHATVVTLYLLTVVNERLRPILEKQLRPGARVVSHDFKIPGWEPTQVVNMTSENGVPHTIYLYVRP